MERVLQKWHWESADQVHASDLVKVYHQSNSLKHKKEQTAVVNHIFTPFHFPSAQSIQPLCLLKDLPTSVMKMMAKSPSLLPCPQSPFPPTRWIPSSGTFLPLMPPPSEEYWAELLALFARPRRHTIERQFNSTPKSRCWSATLNITRSHTQIALKDMRPTIDKPPVSIFLVPTELPSLPNGSLSAQ